MIANSKVRARDKFELVYLVRKKKKEGWKQGKIYQDIQRIKYYRNEGRGSQYDGDDTSQEWICHMWMKLKE